MSEKRKGLFKWTRILMVAFLATFFWFNGHNLRPVFAFNQFPDTTSKTGLFIANYGDPKSYDPSFLANNFDITIESTDQAKQVHAKNPNTVTLRYREMGRQDTTSWWFDNWQDVNKEEEMFLHSTDPAGISFVPENRKLTIYWQPDKRNMFSKSEDNSFILAGYNIYRSTNPNTGFSKLNSSPLSSTSYVDIEVANDTTYYYKIKSVDSVGKEYNFSQVRSGRATDNPASLILANATVSVSTDSNGKTTFDFSVMTKGSPTSVKLYIDLYNTERHTFVDNGEVLAMNDVGNGIYNYSISLRLPDKYKPKASHEYKSGYAFYIQANKGGNTVKLPDSGNYATNTNNRLMNPAYEGYMTDPGSSSWKNHFLNYIKKKLAEGYDGLFIDSASTPTYYTTGGLSDAMPENFNPASFRNDVKDFISFMKQGLGSAPTTYNGLMDADSGYKDLTSDYFEVSDAAMDEEFVFSAWNPRGYFDESGWKTRMNNILKVDSINRGAILQSHGDALNVQGRMFAFASYLIAKGKNTYFYFADKGSYVKPNYYPEWRISLGKPLESYTNVNNYKKSHGAYERRFEKGVAFVNPSDNTVSIALDKTYDRIDVSGGLVPELGGNGKLTLTQINSLSLVPHSGALILNKTGEQPGQEKRGLAIYLRGASGIITSDPEGINCGDDCSEYYAKGTRVILTATPSSGSTFLRWGYDCSGSSPTCTVTMNKDLSVKAVFGSNPNYSSASRHILAIYLRGASGVITSSYGGINCGSSVDDCSQDYPDGATMTLTATPSSGSTFLRWGYDCSGSSPTCTVTMNKDLSVKAVFGTTSAAQSLLPTLRVYKYGTGGGTVVSIPTGIDCGFDCSEGYAIGDKPLLIKLIALPNNDSIFQGWSGVCRGLNTCFVAMKNTNLPVGATFEKSSSWKSSPLSKSQTKKEGKKGNWMLDLLKSLLPKKK